MKGSQPVLRRLAAASALALLFALSRPVAAHDIPSDVTIQAFLKPDGQRLRMLVRVPLVALRDMTWPMRAAGMLDTSRAASELTNAATLWLGNESTMYEEGRALAPARVAAIRATLPTDRSFESYEQALALVTGPPPSESDDITIKEGFLDVLFEYPIQSERSRFSLEPRWGLLGIRAVALLRLVLPGGAVRAFEFQGDPGLVHLDPAWHQVVWRFVKLGFAHPLDDTDLLLFLFCLVVPFRRIGEQLVVVISFMAGYSTTLVASAYEAAPDVLWFPPFIATLIAASIVYTAAENIIGARVHRRWMTACGFGLAYGFGLAFALRPSLQFAGAHPLTSRLAFNLGVELAQLAALALLIPVLRLLFRYVVLAPIGTVVLSALVVHTGWHSMSERAGRLVQYQWTWPDLTPGFLAGVLRWLMAIVALAGVFWLIQTLSRSRRAPGEDRLGSEGSKP